MNKKSVLLGACLLLGATTAFAQKRVTGRVLDAEGHPVVGATVRVEGAKTHTKTDANGRFTLTDLPASAKNLTVSYLGMKTQSVSVSGNLDVVMQDDQQFDEAIVVAYGTSKKSHFTGVASVVGSEEIEKVQVSNPVNALAGRVSGAQINTASGQPGGSPTVRVLGITTVSDDAGKQPLIVVDGSPFDGDMNNINPQDVESISILKDASSTSLYGARGANGVIMITTKKGKVGFSSITFDAKVGSNSRALPDYKYVKSPAKYYELYYKGLLNYFQNAQGLDPLSAHAQANANLVSGSMGLGYLAYDLPAGQDLIGLNGKLNPAATLGHHVGDAYLVTPDDWADVAYRNSVRQEYNLAATGATDVSNFYASFNYLKNEGIAAASSYERLTGRLKADYQLREWLKIGGNFNYSHANANSLGEDGDASSSGNVFAMTKMGAIYPVYIRDAQGNLIMHEASGLPLYDFGDGAYFPYTRPALNKANPLATNLLERNNTNSNMLNAVGEAEIKFLKDFRFRSINSVYLNEGRGTITSNPWFGGYASSNGIVNKGHSRTFTTNFQQTLNWMHTFAGLHNFNVTVGHEYYNRRSYSLSATKSNQFDPKNDELDGAVVDGKNAASSRSRYNTEGWFGFFRYNYAEKYFVSATYRRDASSVFHKDHRWGNFGSIGAGWLINKEDFFRSAAFDELKFRFSYGTNGNDLLLNYLYTNTYSIVNAGGHPAAKPNVKGNQDITWETVGNFTTGFDFSLFGHRLYGSVDYFIRKTSDMLSIFPLTPSYGYTGYYTNVGDMRNMGFLLELNGDIVRTQDFNLSARVNFTAFKNKIVKLPEERRTMVIDGVGGYSSGNYFYGEGESMYTYMLKTYVGVDKNTGEALYAVAENVAKKDGNGRFLDAQGHTFVGSDGKVATDINKLTDEQRGQLVYDGTTANYSEAEDHLQGTALAPVYGGFGLSAEWKGFDFNIDFQYQIGGQVYDSDYQQAMGASRGFAFHADLQKAWTSENPSSSIPRLQYNDPYMTSNSSRWLTNASYLSLNNVSLGYTLPTHLMKTAKISKVRLYVTADNVWLWSKRQGLDPRQSISGSTTSAYYAPIRTVSGGIQVSF